jgi:hypothetical protein
VGYGDDIMASGIARATVEHFRNEEKPLEIKCVFGDPDTFFDPVTNVLKIHQSPVFLNNPNILQPGSNYGQLICIPDYPGSRMGIDYSRCEIRGNEITRFAFRPEFRAIKGDLVFTEEEESAAMRLASELGNDFYVIEPSGKADYHTNKLWPFERWQEFIDSITTPSTFVQFIHAPDTPPLTSGPSATVRQITDTTFREACALMLHGKRGYVGTDGGLHHSAAALGLPAIVLWGHYSSPTNYGYDYQTNIQGRGKNDDAGPCGNLEVCLACWRSMVSISVEEVLAHWSENDAS